MPANRRTRTRSADRATGSRPARPRASPRARRAGRRELADHFRDGRHQRVRIAAGVHEQPPAANVLLERGDRPQRRSGHDVLVVHVGRRPRRCAAVGTGGDELHHRVRPHQILRFSASLFGNIRCARLWLTITTRSRTGAVGLGEVAAREERDAERGEEAGRDRAKPAARILFAVGLRVALDGELEMRPVSADVAPGHESADGDAARRPAARRCAGSPPCRSLREPCACALDERRARPGEHVARSKPACARCSATSAVTSMPAPASSTNEARSGSRRTRAAGGSCPAVTARCPW